MKQWLELLLIVEVFAVHFKYRFRPIEVEEPLTLELLSILLNYVVQECWLLIHCLLRGHSWCLLGVRLWCLFTFSGGTTFLILLLFVSLLLFLFLCVFPLLLGWLGGSVLVLITLIALLLIFIIIIWESRGKIVLHIRAYWKFAKVYLGFLERSTIERSSKGT